MKPRAIVILLPLVCIALTGCLSKEVWNSGSYITPAPTPKLSLFETDRGVLAQYDAMIEHSGAIYRQSYLVEPNLQRVADGKRPIYVNAKNETLKPIPILPITESGRAKLPIYAVWGGDPVSFSVYRQGWVLGPCDLPVFKEHGVTAAKLALMPLAAIGDVAIHAAVSGNYWVERPDLFPSP